MMKPQPKYIKRFLSRLIVDDGCWHMDGTRRCDLSVPHISYAMEEDFDEQGSYLHSCSAARLSLALFQRYDFEKIRQTRHLCDDHTCVNPAHLTEGSRSENQLDRHRPPEAMTRLRGKVAKRLQMYLR